jgi:hypothetical protein
MMVNDPALQRSTLKVLRLTLGAFLFAAVAVMLIPAKYHWLHAHWFSVIFAVIRLFALVSTVRVAWKSDRMADPLVGLSAMRVAIFACVISTSADLEFILR